MTFQELAIRLNYNGPSGAEKTYKSALRKLRKELYSGAYGQWVSVQKAIRSAKVQAELLSNAACVRYVAVMGTGRKPKKT